MIFHPPLHPSGMALFLELFSNFRPSKLGTFAYFAPYVISSLPSVFVVLVVFFLFSFAPFFQLASGVFFRRFLIVVNDFFL